MPTKQTGGGGLAGALSVIIVWAVGAFAHVVIPPEIAAAFAVVVHFGTAYLIGPDA